MRGRRASWFLHAGGAQLQARVPGGQASPADSCFLGVFFTMMEPRRWPALFPDLRFFGEFGAGQIRGQQLGCDGKGREETDAGRAKGDQEPEGERSHQVVLKSCG